MSTNQESRPGARKTGHAPEQWVYNELTEIKHTLAVMSGKGGVGKSTITALTALALARAGHKVGILDADITGPSIPRMFGLKDNPAGNELGMLPVASELGIQVISINLLVETEDTPVVWRGPLLANAVRQFWSEVAWGSLDYLVIDLPPGTGDVPLSVMQSVPLDGLLVVSSPQDLAVMVVKKAIKMAAMMDKRIIGLVENMSHAVCPGCGEKFDLFGPAQGKEVAAREGIRYVGDLPVDPVLAGLCDSGRIESYQGGILVSLAQAVTETLTVKVSAPVQNQ